MNDTVFLIIAGIFGAIIVFAIVYFITSSSRKKKLGVIGMVTNNKGLTQGKLTEFLPNFDNNRFSKNVFRTYINIEQALNTLNLEGIRNMISPELFKQYEGQIAFFKNQGKSLIRQDFTHYYTRIIGVTRQNGEVIANVLLGLEYKEYFLDSANQVIGNNQFPISKEINLLLAVKNNTVKKELPITLMITTAFAVLLSDNIFTKNVTNSFTRGDGIVLLLFFSVFMYYLISMSRNKIDDDSKETYPSMKKACLLTILGLIGIVLGSNFVVDGASGVAKIIGISERMISLTIVAIGTSLPELVTSVAATRKGEYDIAIGNVVGSNIFNIGIVIGIPVAIFGGISKINFSYIDIVVMILSALFLFVFSYNDHKISRKEGIFFLLAFIAYYSYVIFG